MAFSKESTEQCLMLLEKSGSMGFGEQWLLVLETWEVNSAGNAEVREGYDASGKDSGVGSGILRSWNSL